MQQAMFLPVNELKIDWVIYIKPTYFYLWKNDRYQAAARVMVLFNHVRCRSEHTKVFNINSQILMSSVWQNLN